MPTLSQPELLPGPFAYNGDKNDIPDASASLGAASYQQGFPPITQLPVNAGGIPPQRNDFNGILNALSQHTFWQQSGGMYAWSATLDYAVPSMVVGSDKELYFALQPSGPGTAAGAKNPTSGAGKAYWQNIAYVLPVATATKLGGVMVNKGGLQVSASGLLSLLLMQGGGLNLNAAGQLYVDTADFSEEMLRAFLEGIIADGGGLGFDSSGKLYVDADAFSDDLLERFLKSIRVPVWLSRNLTVYVATTGSDTLDEGRGLSPDKPFLTVAAAVQYVSTTYNLYIYNAYIRLSRGGYDLSWLNLPNYSTSTGVIVISGEEDASDSTIIGGIRNNLGGVYYIRNCTVRPSNITLGNPVYAIQCQLGQLQLANVGVDWTGVLGQSFAAFHVSQSGTILVPAMSNNAPEGVSVNAPEKDFIYLYIAGGTFSFSADLTVYGNTTLYRNYSFCYTTNGGRVTRQAAGAGATTPSRLPFVNASGIISGSRYSAIANGIINTVGAGPEFFPGTEAGTTLYGGQYV